MRKFHYILLLLVLYSLVHSIENNHTINKTDLAYHFSLVMKSGPTNGVSIGIGKSILINKKAKEIFGKIHYQTSSRKEILGAYCVINSFKGQKNTGFYYQIFGGIDYVKGSYETFSFGGTDDDNLKQYEGAYPMLSLGCGYAIDIFRNDSIRLAFDIGVKKNFFNFNIEYVFK